MKIRITYHGSVTVEIDPLAVAADAGLDDVTAQTKDSIRKVITEHVAEAASEREWPSFQIDPDDMDEAIDAVSEELISKD